MLPNLSHLASTDGIIAKALFRGGSSEAERRLGNWDARAGSQFPSARYYFYGLLMGSCYSVNVEYGYETAHIRIRHNHERAVFEENSSTNVVGLTIQNCTVETLRSEKPTPEIDKALIDFKTWEVDVSLNQEIGVLEGAAQHKSDNGQILVKLLFQMEEVQQPQRGMFTNTTNRLFRQCD